MRFKHPTLVGTMNPEQAAAKTERGNTGESPVWTYEEFSKMVLFRKIQMLRTAKNLVRTTPKIEAEDLVSMTLEKALKNYSKYEVRGETEESRANYLSAWMARILRNGWLEQVRKMKRHGEQAIPEGFEFESSEPDPERTALINDLLVQALKNIEELPPEQREALMLSAAEGMSYAEIAAWQTAASGVEVPEGTVKSRISRARKALGGSSTLDDFE